ncbi:hypothetical protein [Promicromonospora sp. NPDC057488]|uniref:hypothetical protein n=1 Tax=Promicromonospora sp. NPDC057488 TaxID=3346147 RepID=UPI003671BF35
MDVQQMVDALDHVEISIHVGRTLFDGSEDLSHPATWFGQAIIEAESFPDELSVPVKVSGCRIGGRTFNLREALDAPSVDTAWFLPLLDDADEPEEELGLIEPWGDLLLVDRASTHPAWQHLGGIGRYLIGLILREITDGIGAVVLHAHPYQYAHSGTDDEIRAGEAKLLEVWESLGFKRFRDTQIMTLDPHSTALDDAINELREAVRTHRHRGEP